jgi:hypothetical protein
MQKRSNKLETEPRHYRFRPIYYAAFFLLLALVYLTGSTYQSIYHAHKIEGFSAFTASALPLQVASIDGEKISYRKILPMAYYIAADESLSAEEVMIAAIDTEVRRIQFQKIIDTVEGGTPTVDDPSFAFNEHSYDFNASRKRFGWSEETYKQYFFDLLKAATVSGAIIEEREGVTLTDFLAGDDIRYFVNVSGDF